MVLYLLFIEIGYVITLFPFICFCFGATLAEFRTYSWPYTQGSPLAEFKEPYVVRDKPESAFVYGKCLPTVQSFQPPSTLFLF